MNIIAADRSPRSQLGSERAPPARTSDDNRVGRRRQTIPGGRSPTDERSRSRPGYNARPAAGVILSAHARTPAYN